MLSGGIFHPLYNSPEFSNIIRGIEEKGFKQQMIFGLTGSSASYFTAALRHTFNRTLVVVSQGISHARRTAEELKALLPEVEVLVLPPRERVPGVVIAQSKESLAQRQRIFEGLLAGEPLVILAHPDVLTERVVSQDTYSKGCYLLEVGKTVNLENLLTLLVENGYERVDMVEGGGQFSLRGGILDLFPLTEENPVRVELFDDEIDSIRIFDTANQRSLEKIQSARITPATERQGEVGGTTFLTYLKEGSLLVFEEPQRIKQQVDFLLKESPKPEELISYTEFNKIAGAYPAVYLSLLPKQVAHVKPQSLTSFGAKAMHPFLGQVNLLADEIKAFKKAGNSILITASTAERAKKLHQTLKEEKVDAYYISKVEKELKPGNVIITEGDLPTGFELSQAKLVVITDTDIYGQRKRGRTGKVSTRKGTLAPFIDLKPGDFVVHINHGIGKYLGVENLEIAGIRKDYFLVKYAGEDKLYVPTDQVDLIQKYLGADEQAPKLYKLGGADWQKVKTRVKESVQNMARDLLTLYAVRQALQGQVFSPDTVWQKEFEDIFPFEETPDQLRAIREIKTDMENPKPMDRLLCGDVGYGKTEVALRAAFKAVMDSKQVAVLVPTTILAQQHYNTFKERFAGFPVTIEMISRFRSAKEQEQIIKNAKKGLVDVLIGTHRIVQEDIKFKNLGLLIVDEEQRFGVGHKEKLKQLTKNIDVLTLTATPIPRTLHMSLIGARDMSILETPPENRFPIQTYVLEYNGELIRDAITREINRGGQVYFVHNRVNDIEKTALKLQDLIPEARIAIGHGQMREDQLEQVMLDFMDGQYDVLVCTTIIETGLDLPNVNTLIVDEADHMGLAQLYQLRGRVGRANRLAYAYLTYKKDKVLSENAEKRLQAISEFTAFGSGFKIAMRDLEIRGAGNILGPEQHGHMLAVGFDMYCRLLEEAVQELKGEPVVQQLEPTIEIPVDAYISEAFIPDSGQKIEIYKKIMAVQNDEDAVEIEDEIVDRFGDLPPSVQNLLAIARIRGLAKEYKIQSINYNNGIIHLKFFPENELTGKTFAELYNNYGRKLSFAGTTNPEIKLKSGNLRQEEILVYVEKFIRQIKSVEACSLLTV